MSVVSSSSMAKLQLGVWHPLRGNLHTYIVLVVLTRLLGKT
jgi:hypothetical protein